MAEIPIRAEVLAAIADLAAAHGIQKVVLFGSRARGDQLEKSDIDLAVSGGNAALFRLAVDEETPTLLQFDVVNLDDPIAPALRENIEREGVLLYEAV